MSENWNDYKPSSERCTHCELRDEKIEQLQKDKKKLKGIMRSIHQRALNAAPIIDIVVLSRQALEEI